MNNETHEIHVTLEHLVDSGEFSNTRREKHDVCFMKFKTIPREGEVLEIACKEWKVYKVVHIYNQVDKVFDTYKIKAERWVYGLEHYRAQEMSSKHQPAQGG